MRNTLYLTILHRIGPYCSIFCLKNAIPLYLSGLLPWTRLFYKLTNSPCYQCCSYPYIGVCVCSQSRCALLRVQDGENRITLSLVSPFGHSDDDLDLAAAMSADDGDLLLTSAACDDVQLSLGVVDTRLSLSSQTSADAMEVPGGSSGSSAGSKSNSVGVGTNDRKVLQSVEATVGALLRRSTSAPGVTSADASSAESNMWMKISGLKDMSVLMNLLAMPA